MNTRPPPLTVLLLSVVLAIIAACPHGTPTGSEQPASDAVESAGIELTNLEPPGAFEVTNVSGASIELASTVAIESMDSGTWGAGPASRVELIEACGRPAPRCVRLDPGERLRPPAWSGLLCSGQCPETTNCKKNPDAAGTHRFVLTSCDGKQRFTGPAFALASDGTDVTGPSAAVGAERAREASPSAAAAPPLSLSLAMSRTSYSAGEPVDAVLQVENVGTDPITLVHPDYWGVSELEVVDESGATVARSTFKAERKAVARWMKLAAGERRAHAFERLTGYTCCHAYTYKLPPGRYEARVRITNPPLEVGLPPGDMSTWTGSLTSGSAAFEIR
ncbi:hypothetical protein [Nannocystis punicea]|uniref:Uncharacterized protein n=1 Tax=Nannocystis punicea TaxID=2995304 RepID=A0ABY7HBX5_9BACT|nr:hypothetical protein [Nannocystis poenicansa]WAS96772.1 hypothetical protein O0S08_11535 [Nannocystis poenicansa]